MFDFGDRKYDRAIQRLRDFSSTQLQLRMDSCSHAGLRTRSCQPVPLRTRGGYVWSVSRNYLLSSVCIFAVRKAWTCYVEIRNSKNSKTRNFPVIIVSRCNNIKWDCLGSCWNHIALRFHHYYVSLPTVLLVMHFTYLIGKTRRLLCVHSTCSSH